MSHIFTPLYWGTYCPHSLTWVIRKITVMDYNTGPFLDPLVLLNPGCLPCTPDPSLSLCDSRREQLLLWTSERQTGDRHTFWLLWLLFPPVCCAGGLQFRVIAIVGQIVWPKWQIGFHLFWTNRVIFCITSRYATVFNNSCRNWLNTDAIRLWYGCFLLQQRNLTEAAYCS